MRPRPRKASPTTNGWSRSSIRKARSCISRPTSRCRSTAALSLAPFSIAYQTYGTLNEDKSNLVLVCHALTGDQHVANLHPVTGKPGWWETMVGPGKPIDTDRYFVLCPNVIGGCMGSTGPSSINPADWAPLRPRLSRHHRARHGARAGAPARSSRRAGRALRARRLDGRHAGAGMGRDLQGPRVLRGADRLLRRAIPRRTSPSTRSAARR